jgi:hypothetical protein
VINNFGIIAACKYQQSPYSYSYFVLQQFCLIKYLIEYWLAQVFWKNINKLSRIHIRKKSRKTLVDSILLHALLCLLIDEIYRSSHYVIYPYKTRLFVLAIDLALEFRIIR